MSFLNTDIKRRDELIFKDGFQFERYSCGGIRYFKDLTLDTLKSLKRENFLDASDAQNSSPTIQEFMEFMDEHPGFTAHGYAVIDSRSDYRVSIEGLEKDGDISRDDLVDFVDMNRWADKLNVSDNWLRCWYD